jgi:hypothetical protein
MPQDHIGYLEFDGRIARFHEARCCFKEGQLDAQAEGSKCRLKLYGIPFSVAGRIKNLPDEVFGPDADTVRDDPIAEVGVELKGVWLSYLLLTLKCRTYDPGSGSITVLFEGEVVEAETGCNGTVEGMVRCRVVEGLW